MRALHRRTAFVLLVVTLLSLLPRATTYAVPRGPTSSQTAAPPPAIIDDGTGSLPRPAAAQSTSLVTAVVNALMDVLDATETASTTFDGTFSQGVRHEVWREDGTYTLQNQTNRIIEVPPGAHTSLEIDTTSVHVTGNWEIAASIAVRAKGTTPWKHGTIVTSHGANTTAVKHHVRFTAGGFVPSAAVMEVQLRCGSASNGTCTFQGLSVFEDTPGWSAKDSTEPFNHTTGMYADSFTTSIAAFEAPRTMSADPGRGNFLGIERDSSGYGVVLWSEMVRMPVFNTTTALTASMRWNRIPETPDSNRGAVQVHFIPLANVGATSMIAIPAGLDSQGWQTTTSPANALSPTKMSGQVGKIQVHFLDSVEVMLGVDSLQFYLNGTPITLSLATPADQLAGECVCDVGGQPQQFRYDPVNTASGSLTVAATDLTVPTGDTALTFQRSYGSLLADTAKYPTTALGPGWRHTFNEALTLQSSQKGYEGHTVIYEAASGNRYRFWLMSGSYHAAPGVRATLTKGADNVFTLMTAERHVLRFANTGRLLERRTAQGHVQTLEYGTVSTLPSYNQVLTVTDQLSQRHLFFTYHRTTAGDRLQSVRDDLARTITYTYTAAGALQSVTDLRGAVTSYTYTSAHLLEDIINPATTTALPQVHTTYVNGKVATQTYADGRYITYRYTPDPVTLGQRTTIQVTHPQTSGSVDVEEFYYRANGTLRFTTRNGEFTGYSAFGANLTPSAILDGQGAVTRITSNPAGKPTTITDDMGMTTRLTYHADNRLIAVATPNGMTTTLHYDVSGNVTEMLQQAADTASLRNTLTYTPRNQVETSTTPDGVVTRFTYDAVGQVETMTVGDGTAFAMTTRYGYDGIGRRTTVTTGYGTPLARTDRTIYRPDGNVERVIQNERGKGVFDPVLSDQNVWTQYGYDILGRRIWTQTVDGVYHGVTRYNAAGQVLWTAEHTVDSNGVPMVPNTNTPPTYSPAYPDANVATLYGYDGFGRTTLVTQTGILTGTFVIATPQSDGTTTPQFDGATTRVTRTQYDSLSRPVTTTLNYRTDINAGRFTPAHPDVNVQTLTYYDGAGRVIWQRDALSRWTKTEYDAVGRVVKTVQNYENGNPLTVDPANHQSAPDGWTDGSDTDLVTVTRYDSLGRVAGTITNYVDGIVNTVTNDGNMTITDVITDQLTLTHYDAFSRVISSTVNVAPTAQGYESAWNYVPGVTQYNATTGQVQAVQDAMGQWNIPVYDAVGRIFYTIQNCRNTAGEPVSSGCAASDVSQVVDRTIRTDAVYYDALGRSFETKNVLGITTHRTYDGLSRVTETIENYVAGGVVDSKTNVKTTTSYLDVGGHAWRVTDPTTRATTYQTNGLGQTVVITDAANLLTRSGYDGTGTQRWTKTPDGRIGVSFVDGLGRVVRTVENYQDGVEHTDTGYDLTTRIRYDAAGRQAALIDRVGRETRYDYDLRDQLVQVTENVKTATQCPSSATDCTVITQYRYDRAGNRIAVIDARNVVQQHSTYDALGRLTFEWNPSLSFSGKSYTYNKRGQVMDIDASLEGQSQMFSYDELGRLTWNYAQYTVGYETGLRRFTYDALGRRTSFYDESAATVGETGVISYTYDALNRATVQTSSLDGDASATPIGIAVNYDAAGRVMQVGGTYYDYDTAGRPWKIRRNSTVISDDSYDAVGRFQQRQYYVAGSVVAKTTTAYDVASRVQSLTSVGATTVGGTATGALSTLTYTYNRANEVTTFGETQRTSSGASTTSSTTYSYDGLGRLTSESVGGTATTYQYDRAGNRTAVLVNGTTTQSYTYNGGNQVTNAGWSYDEDGNLLSDGSKTYRYDAFGRVREVVSGGSTYGYRYHGESLATRSVNGTLQTSFLYDTITSPNSHMLRIRNFQTPGSTIYTTYANDLSGKTIWSELFNNGTTTNNGVFLADRLGTTRQVYNPSTAVSTPVSGDAWGVTSSTSATSMRFTGEYSDVATGLVFLRARWYNPATGTLLGRDPFDGYPTLPYSLHPYQYGYSDPVGNTDPSGMCVDADADGRCEKSHAEPSTSSIIYLPYVQGICHENEPTAFLSPIVHDTQGADIGYIEGGSLTRGLMATYNIGREKVFDLADFEYAEFTYSGWGASTDVYSVGSYFGFVKGWSNTDPDPEDGKRHIDTSYSGEFYVASAGFTIPLAATKLFGTSAVGFTSPDGNMYGAAQSFSAGVGLPLPVSASGSKVFYVMEGNRLSFRSDPDLPPTLEDAQRFAQFARDKIDNPIFEEVVVEEIYTVQRTWK